MLLEISNKIFSFVASFRRDTRGNIAITFALATIPIIAFVGSAVDFSRANKAKAALDAIADSSALQAVAKTSLAINASSEQSTVAKIFKAQASLVPQASLGTVSATVTDGGMGRSAVVNYTATVPTFFMGLMAVKNIAIAGSSTANSAVPTYVDFYLLLDNTPSMGVGATPTDVATMVNNTPDQCAFACHDLSAVPNDYYSLAKRLGVTMRINVVASATQQLMSTASNTATVSNQFRMAIYTFGVSDVTAGLTPVQTLTSNLTLAQTAASTIDIMATSYQNYNSDQDTNFDQILPQMNNAIPTPGDGSSASSPQKVLFFVTDGVADEYNTSCQQPSPGGGRCMEPVNTALCTAIKNRGIKIAVLYTTYLALPTNSWYMSWVDPFNVGPYGPSPNSQVAINLQNCASPGLYFEVSPTGGISTAMTALFQKAVTQARLTK